MSRAANSAQDALIVARSIDGGKNLEQRRSRARLRRCRLLSDSTAGSAGPANALVRAVPHQQLSIDGDDPTNGTIAIVWADNEGAGSCGSGAASFTGVTSNQVKLVTSSNGSVWTAPTRITSPGSPDKVYPSVGANAGRIVVGYYTREYSPAPTDTDRRCGIAELDTATNAVVLPVDPARRSAPVCLDWALKSSTDGFGAQTRVSRESSNPYILFAGSFIGDYTGIAVDSSGSAVTVWTDNRGNPGVTPPNQDAVVAVGR